MKTSPLHEIHESLGASFADIADWEVPSHYGDPVAEHLHVRKSAGIMDISHRGKIRIFGRDRTDFLQRILSQDIHNIVPHTSASSTLLDVKGKMLAWMRIYADDDSFLIDVEPGLAGKVIQILTRYLFREDVQIEDFTEKYGMVTIQGPLSGKVLQEIIPMNHVLIKVDSARLGEEGFDIYALWNSLPPLWDALFESGSVPSLKPFGHIAWDTLRIEAGTPLYSVDMDEHTIPLEANLEEAINYNKGCYTGQETIARIKFRGHVNRTFTGFSLNEKIIPEKGSSIYKLDQGTEDNIGFITSGCFSPTLNRAIALGYIRTEFNKTGESVTIEKGGHRVQAKVTILPFYHKDKK